MTRILKFVHAAALAAGIALAVHPAQARAEYSQAELEQMLAPIALYPDELLFQVLAAATRPLEVVEAARWSRANPGLQGDEAVRAAVTEPWDPSVKALLGFPQLLARMDENLEWTKALGVAYFVQEPAVLETIQTLRQRARAADQLDSDERVNVIEQGAEIYIEPATPQVVYLPYYDPAIAYGTWLWPNYPPVAWAPWPGYVVVRRPGTRPGFWWGAPVGVSTGLLYHRTDWPRRRPERPRPGSPSAARPEQPRQSTPQPPAPRADRPQPQFEPRQGHRPHEDRPSAPALNRPAPIAAPTPPAQFEPRQVRRPQVRPSAPAVNRPAPIAAPTPTAPAPQVRAASPHAEPAPRAVPSPAAQEAPQRPGVSRP